MSEPRPKTIKLALLTTLDPAVQMKIRDLRNEENVRKWMYTEHRIDADEHRRWIGRLQQDERQLVFAVLDDEAQPLGVVSVNSIDRLHGKADWAYYLTDTARGGLGSAIEFAFVNFVFDTLGMEKLNCEVIEGNDPVVKLHKKFLFQEEGFRRSNILKHGIRLGVHFLGLTREDWLAGRNEIQDRYKFVFDRYQVEIECRNLCKGHLSTTCMQIAPETCQ